MKKTDESVDALPAHVMNCVSIEGIEGDAGVTATQKSEISSTGKKRKAHQRIMKRGGGFAITILVFLMITISLLSFVIGRYDMTVLDALEVVANQLFGLSFPVDKAHETVVMRVRFPRILSALVIGAALAIAGASYQGLFKNPMCSPDLLGASAGAGFGASYALLLNGNMFAVQLAAFVCGIVAVGLTYFVSKAVSRGGSMVLSLVLTGMVVAALFQACITMAKFVADPNDKLPAITFWLMGGLSSISVEDLPLLLIPVLAGIIPMVLFRYQLNALSFGEEEARALGVNTRFIRRLFICCATLVTSASVAAAGMIGWVGLVIPHLARMIVGPNYRALIPASLLLGALYLLIIDDMCRYLFTIELPLSVLTAIIGAPFFVYLLLRGRNTWV